jgi:hypothetical protein
MEHVNVMKEHLKMHWDFYAGRGKMDTDQDYVWDAIFREGKSNMDQNDFLNLITWCNHYERFWM